MKYYIGSMAYGREDIQHHGILGMKWGVRRYQNPDGSLTELGKLQARQQRLDEQNAYWTKNAHQTFRKGRTYKLQKDFMNIHDNNFSRVSGKASAEGKKAADTMRKISKEVERARSAERDIVNKKANELEQIEEDNRSKFSKSMRGLYSKLFPTEFRIKTAEEQYARRIKAEKSDEAQAAHATRRGKEGEYSRLVREFRDSLANTVGNEFIASVPKELKTQAKEYVEYMMDSMWLKKREVSDVFA